jgi:hypothetical protein
MSPDEQQHVQDWLARIVPALGLDAALVDEALILDLARDAAHGVARPAAPLTTYLLGLAAGRAGADAAGVRQFAERITGEIAA